MFSLVFNHLILRIHRFSLEGDFISSIECNVATPCFYSSPDGQTKGTLTFLVATIGESEKKGAQLVHICSFTHLFCLMSLHRPQHLTASVRVILWWSGSFSSLLSVNSSDVSLCIQTAPFPSGYFAFDATFMNSKSFIISHIKHEMNGEKKISAINY